MVLLSYDPFLGDSPYRQAGPIYVHVEPECTMAILGGITAPGDEKDGGDLVPEQLRRRMLSLRAFDGRHMMVGTAVVLGDELVVAVRKLCVEGDGVEYVHVHFAGPGCFAVRIDRDK